MSRRARAVISPSLPLRTSLALAAALLLLTGCGSGWGWYEVLPTTPRGRDNFLFMLSGFWLTIAISGTAIMFSVLIGLLVALPGLARDKRLRWFNRVYVEIFRAIPILVMLLWTYYGLPILLGLSMTPFVAGVVALALCDSAFEAEIFRAGIQSIERGQIDGADSLGLSYVQKMRFVVLPQAIRRILPALGNQFVYMLKMSSLVYVLGLPELTRRANELSVTVYRPLEIYSVLVLEYLVLILVVSWLVRRLEKRLGANVLHAGG
ncbi:amino acid ABC transporter permease [Pelagibius sp. 7325]|uniref:amino acid ABC transporter permease n=1 Tax=Pelagibius sp. 7325 TaxID=3131994 RepID=UPI0030EF7CE4